MSFDLYLAPAAGFKDWTDERWQAFIDGEAESENIGPVGYIGLVEDAITYHLEDGRAGSRYPLLLGRSTDDVVGWYGDEIRPLADEIRSIKQGFAALPVNPSTLAFDGDGRMQPFIERLRRRDPTRPLHTFYDLFKHYVDAYEQMTAKALAGGKGLWLSF